MGFAATENTFTQHPSRNFCRNLDEHHIAPDEQGFATGRLKPTQMIAVMTPGPAASHLFSPGISPEVAVRRVGI